VKRFGHRIFSDCTHIRPDFTFWLNFTHKLYSKLFPAVPTVRSRSWTSIGRNAVQHGELLNGLFHDSNPGESYLRALHPVLVHGTGKVRYVIPRCSH